MIQHVYERARLVHGLSCVLVATDDDRIAEVVKAFGGDVVMTRYAIRLDVLVDFREPKTATAATASPGNTRFGINDNAPTVHDTTTQQR